MINESENSWLAIHIFYKNELNLLLLKLIDPVVNEWYQQNLIMNHFFVRYWEGGQHIRLRIKPDNMLSKAVIVKDLIETYENNFAGSKDYDEEFKIAFVDYRQELSRYGGPYSIGLAETAFEQSSIMAMGVLKKHGQDWDNSMAISIALQAHILFMKASGESLTDTVYFLEFLFDNYVFYSIKDTSVQNFRKEVDKNKDYFEKSYLSQKNTIDHLCKAIWEQKHWEDNDWRGLWIKSIKKIIKDFHSLESKGILEEPQWLSELITPKVSQKVLLKWVIWSSYFHMTNNRLGIHLRDESFIYHAMKNGISSLIDEKTQV